MNAARGFVEAALIDGARPQNRSNYPREAEPGPSMSALFQMALANNGLQFNSRITIQRRILLVKIRLYRSNRRRISATVAGRAQLVLPSLSSNLPGVFGDNSL